MNLENYFREQSQQRHNEMLELSYRLGFLKGSLAKLESIVNSGKIQTDEFTMTILKELAQAYQTSEVRAKERYKDITN